MITATLLRVLAPKTIPDAACADGMRGQRMRLAEHPPGPARDAYACVMRECATGLRCQDEVPFSRLRAPVLVALGMAIGLSLGMVMGAASVARADAGGQVAP